MRMYFFVNMYLSDKQKGIQAGHCVEGYARIYGNTPEYLDYITNHKTWIILNGGDSRCLENGEMNNNPNRHRT